LYSFSTDESLFEDICQPSTGGGGGAYSNSHRMTGHMTPPPVRHRSHRGNYWRTISTEEQRGEPLPLKDKGRPSPMKDKGGNHSPSERQRGGWKRGVRTLKLSCLPIEIWNEALRKKAGMCFTRWRLSASVLSFHLVSENNMATPCCRDFTKRLKCCWVIVMSFLTTTFDL